MLKIAILFFLFAVIRSEASEWVYLRPEVGAGYTDNVYQDDFNKKADSFFWFAASSKYRADDSTWAGKLNLNVFGKEDANNYASYSVKRSSELQSLKADLTLGLGGLSYLEKSRGSTDESYNNYYLIGYLTKTLKETNRFSLYAEPGAKVTSYPDLDKRLDTTVYFALNSVWKTRATTEIDPYGELGFLFSSQGYYSKNYIDLGVTWIEKLSDADKVSFDFFLRNSIYVNRKVSDILFVPNRAGRGTSKSVETRETTGLRQLTASLTHSLQDIDLTAGLSHASETSSSDLEHYEENRIFISATWNF
jgi:hypothetical protein